MSLFFGVSVSATADAAADSVVVDDDGDDDDASQHISLFYIKTCNFTLNYHVLILFLLLFSLYTNWVA